MTHVPGWYAFSDARNFTQESESSGSSETKEHVYSDLLRARSGGMTFCNAPRSPRVLSAR